MTRTLLLAVAALIAAAPTYAQAPGKWPPDSLVNLQVIGRTTSVIAVWGQMRNMAGALGVECTYCHVGNEGASLEEIDYASDSKRSKQVAREMLRLVDEANRRLTTLPERPSPTISVTCRTCHRGVPRPVPLSTIVSDAAMAADADSAIGAYQAMRARYYGRDAYDFGEASLNTAAFRVARGGRVPDALALLRLNESLFPDASALHITRGNVYLMTGDTTLAASAFRAALQKDPANEEARSRLRDIGRSP